MKNLPRKDPCQSHKLFGVRIVNLLRSKVAYRNACQQVHYQIFGVKFQSNIHVTEYSFHTLPGASYQGAWVKEYGRN